MNTTKHQKYKKKLIYQRQDRRIGVVFRNRIINSMRIRDRSSPGEIWDLIPATAIFNIPFSSAEREYPADERDSLSTAIYANSAILYSYPLPISIRRRRDQIQISNDFFFLIKFLIVRPVLIGVDSTNRYFRIYTKNIQKSAGRNWRV